MAGGRPADCLAETDRHRVFRAAIAGGRLYHFARFDNVDRLTCFDAQTGAELWKCEHPTEYEDMFGYNNGPRATPVIDGDRVYTFSAEGLLQCVRVADGKPVWRIDTMSDFRVVKEFFWRGQHAAGVGRLAYCERRRQPRGKPARRLQRERLMCDPTGPPSSRSTS